LGEVMLRLDPGANRIHTTRHFDVWEGGGEYNVARGLRRCFGLRTAIVTALVDNPVGRLLEDLMLQAGVDQSHLVWRPFDGVGKSARNGLNFTERGFGARAAVGCYDRGHSAASLLAPGDVPWSLVFEQQGARWFHTGGVFASLGKHTAELAEEAISSARRAGARVSYDLNYRPSLWQSQGGRARAEAVNRKLVQNVDVLFGDVGALGFELPEGNPDDVDFAALGAVLQRVLAEFPNLTAVAIPLRTGSSASVGGWGAIGCERGQTAAVPLRRVETFDRVGAGDAFAAGFIFGQLQAKGLQFSVECAAAHGALTLSTPGDNSMASLAEVENHMSGARAGIQR
jgi:2-dehydro-3-deoxygluconokinase